jgi:hypothetical protein
MILNIHDLLKHEQATTAHVPIASPKVPAVRRRGSLAREKSTDNICSNQALITQESIEGLKILIGDERNGNVFYGDLFRSRARRNDAAAIHCSGRARAAEVVPDTEPRIALQVIHARIFKPERKESRDFDKFLIVLARIFQQLTDAYLVRFRDYLLLRFAAVEYEDIRVRTDDDKQQD